MPFGTVDKHIRVSSKKLVDIVFLNNYIIKNIEKYGTDFKLIKDWFKSYTNLNYQMNNMQNFVQVIISGVTTKKMFH